VLSILEIGGEMFDELPQGQHQSATKMRTGRKLGSRADNGSCLLDEMPSNRKLSAKRLLTLRLGF
jgi:hypothetical protein